VFTIASPPWGEALPGRKRASQEFEKKGELGMPLGKNGWRTGA